VADETHIAKLREGVESWNKWRVDVWNKWRAEFSEVPPELSVAYLTEPDLSGANFSKADLSGADLSKADLSGANFSKANLSEADLCIANLTGANLSEANLMNAVLTEANLSQANLTEANLSGAYLNSANCSEANLYEASLFSTNLRGANLSKANLVRAVLSNPDFLEANLSEANLFGAILVQANFSKADLSGADLSMADLEGATLIDTNVKDTFFTGCKVYGISVWNLKGEPKEQKNLLITRNSYPYYEPAITVDNLEVAQFIYLLSKYEKLRSIIDIVSSKVILILGRFTDERKSTLDAIREELRKFDFVPVQFDFDKPESRSFISTVSTIAHLARFVIADFTDPKIILQEVPHIAPIGVPIRPILQAGCDEPSELSDLRNVYKTILDTYFYNDTDDLIRSLEEKVIEPANALRMASIESNKRESEKIVQAIREKRD
jgi:uncharacterized protein YjbI with pentapeptide repeats